MCVCIIINIYGRISLLTIIKGIICFLFNYQGCIERKFGIVYFHQVQSFLILFFGLFIFIYMVIIMVLKHRNMILLKAMKIA